MHYGVSVGLRSIRLLDFIRLDRLKSCCPLPVYCPAHSQMWLTRAHTKLRFTSKDPWGGGDVRGWIGGPDYPGRWAVLWAWVFCAKRRKTSDRNIWLSAGPIFRETPSAPPWVQKKWHVHKSLPHPKTFYTFLFSCGSLFLAVSTRARVCVCLGVCCQIT